MVVWNGFYIKYFRVLRLLFECFSQTNRQHYDFNVGKLHLRQITFLQAQSGTDSLATSSPEDEVSKIQEKGLAILEIRILTANLPADLLVTYSINYPTITIYSN